MQGLPSHEVFQQRHARTVSGEDLEVFGKRAALGWSEGKYTTLTDAVVETVKHATLSPEQVQRIVEFTNTSAFLSEFKKEGSHKYVDFGAGGPADPRAVLQDLNDGGGGSVFDPGTGDYFQPPTSRTKTASDDSALAEAFSAEEQALPQHNPYSEVMDLRDKLASAHDNYTAMVSGLENMLGDLRERLFFQVKQATLSGHSLGEVVNIWEKYAPDPEYVKVAFDLVCTRLLDSEVFFSGEDIVASLQKTASHATPNPEHPLVAEFCDLCLTLNKLALFREDREEVGKGVEQLETFLKRAAAEGLVHKGVKALQSVAGKADEYGQRAGEALLGPGKGKWLGTAGKVGVYAAPVVAGNELYRGTLKHNPVKQRVMAAIPGTQEYNQREYQLMANSQPMY